MDTVVRPENARTLSLEIVNIWRAALNSDTLITHKLVFYRV